MNNFLKKTICILISLSVLTFFIWMWMPWFQEKLAEPAQISIIAFLSLIILLQLFDFYYAIIKFIVPKKESNETQDNKKSDEKISSEKYFELIESQNNKIDFYKAKLKEIKQNLETTTDSERIEKLEKDRRKYINLIEQEKLVLEKAKKNFLEQ